MCVQLNNGLQDSSGNFPVQNKMDEYIRFKIGTGPMVSVIVTWLIY